MAIANTNGRRRRSAGGPTVESRARYIIAPRRGSLAARAGVRPLSAAMLHGFVSGIGDVEVVRVLKPRRAALATFSTVPEEASEIYVVEMDRDRYHILKQSAPPHLIIERDAYVGYGSAMGVQGIALPKRVRLQSAEGMKQQSIKVRVLGEQDAPVARAKVMLQGDGFPAEGETDEAGEITMQLVTAPGNGARSLFVDSLKDYWTYYVVNPSLSADETNIVRLRSLRETISGFPTSYKFGWGQRLMGLDAVPDGCTGKGIKVAIIDSGADTSHPLLNHLRRGVDLTNNGDTKSWVTDVVGHGTHCAGIIAAQGSDGGTALRSFVPDAEVHILKIFPGGQFSSLLDALDYCIDNDIDVVNMSLGSADVSAAVEQKIEEATLQGVACIVAAGNSGGAVQYPASSPNVLAVAAVGKTNEVPDFTWDSATAAGSVIAPDGIFSPSFTCYGPQIAVCAPGVGIISTVPGGYDAESGTSMAAPHVTGFAALALAHHPLFKGQLRTRNATRVAALFQLLRSASVPYNLGNGRTGAGLPRLHGLVDAMRAPMVDVPGGPSVAAQPEAERRHAAAVSAQIPGGAAVEQALHEVVQSEVQRALQALLSNRSMQLPPALLAMLLAQRAAASGAGMTEQNTADLVRLLLSAYQSGAASWGRAVP